ncbi:hypothetical protein ACH47Z_41010 [Streptomyces sp. NPDC020192]|uniref:hypothetical protein n=1 Tax=Streptomyces sp. NPDC020192 TaxID=3365066 RepID=UPI00379B1502
MSDAARPRARHTAARCHHWPDRRAPSGVAADFLTELLGDAEQAIRLRETAEVCLAVGRHFASAVWVASADVEEPTP